jgi:hypothetical protein
MTTYIPALTLPDSVFLKPALSVLLPIGLGTAVGFSATRELTFSQVSANSLINFLLQKPRRHILH